MQILNPAGRKMLGIAAAVEGAPISALSPAAVPLAARRQRMPDDGRSDRAACARGAAGQRGDAPGCHRVARLGQSEGEDAGGVICLFSDLTAVIALEEQLRLKETLARLGELTAGIAHEFRNGLATIHGYGKLIDPSALPPQYKPYVEGIRQETEALGQVVTNFLNFARPTQLSLATHDLAALVQRAADDLKNEVQQLGGEIVVTGQFGQVDADDVLLRQAFSNLLRNAVEACQPAGCGAARPCRGVARCRADQARVSVHDNGPGVDPDARDRIFRPFFTTKKTGTGLGLALVQKIIVTHNGRVTAGSSPSGGACFQVTLPLALVVSSASDVAARVIFRPSPDRRNCHPALAGCSTRDRHSNPPLASFVTCCRLRRCRSRRALAGCLRLRPGHDTVAARHSSKYSWRCWFWQRRPGDRPVVSGRRGDQRRGTRHDGARPRWPRRRWSSCSRRDRPMRPESVDHVDSVGTGRGKRANRHPRTPSTRGDGRSSRSRTTASSSACVSDAAIAPAGCAGCRGRRSVLTIRTRPRP